MIADTHASGGGKCGATAAVAVGDKVATGSKPACASSSCRSTTSEVSVRQQPCARQVATSRIAAQIRAGIFAGGAGIEDAHVTAELSLQGLSIDEADRARARSSPER